MSNLFGNKWRLKPSILTSFVLLTVPVFLTTITVTYISNDRIARADADKLVARFTTEAINNMQGDLNPIKSLVRSVAVLGDTYPDIFADARSMAYFQGVLVHSRKIVSVYVGLENGSFRQARRIDPAVEIQGKLPPDGAIYAYRWVERSKESARDRPPSTAMNSSMPANRRSAASRSTRPTILGREAGTEAPAKRVPS